MKNKKIKKFLTLLTFIPGFLSLYSCDQDEPGDSPFTGPEIETPAESTVLIYAVATNNLADNLEYYNEYYLTDKEEMLMAAEEIDLAVNNVLIFQTVYEIDFENKKYTGNIDVSLVKLVKNKKGDYSWERVKDYNDGVASLDPARIREVVDYVGENFPADRFGMIFWSHSTGAQPYFANESKSVSVSSVSLPMQYSFGQDKTFTEGEPYYQINVDDLANVLPDNMLDFIWFDSCYMSNIESIYQLRNKCDTFVGYATEVMAAGMPYHYVLPNIVGKNADLVEAAKSFYEYYANSIATIAVTDMTKIEELAQFCRNIYGPALDVSSTGFMKYTRYSTGPFYDLGDYTKALAAANGMLLTDEDWEQILAKCVIYKAATPYDFSSNRIYSERYSGISTHVYSFAEEDTKEEEYYKSLDWFKSVFNPIPIPLD